MAMCIVKNTIQIKVHLIHKFLPRDTVSLYVTWFGRLSCEPDFVKVDHLKKTN